MCHYSHLGGDYSLQVFGNIHGKYPANWKGLDFGVLKTEVEVTNGVPLVLHGGTGIPAEIGSKAISLGVFKNSM